MSLRMKFRQSLPHQIKNIGQLRNKIGIDDDTYRAILCQYTRADGQPCGSSKDLSEDQAEELVSLWSKTAAERGIVVHLFRVPQKGVATAQQLATLRARAIRCAIHYAMEDMAYDIGMGVVLTGDDLRRWCLRRWQNKAALPQSILRALFSRWINRKSNQFLVEGGLRTYVRDESQCFYDRMTPKEVSYLIKRFGLIVSELDMSEYAEPSNAQVRRN